MPVTSVCDVGCGDGMWLRAFRYKGVTDVVGIDGEYMIGDLLQIPVGQPSADGPASGGSLATILRSGNLARGRRTSTGKPGVGFVEDLTRLAPMVLFSAAIPGQGGRDHLNEQWQTYWNHQVRVVPTITSGPVRDFTEPGQSPIQCFWLTCWQPSGRDGVVREERHRPSFSDYPATLSSIAW
jgi:hypothetical protein